MRPSEQFVSALSDAVEKNITNPQFGVEDAAKELSMTRSELFMKVHYFTGKSINRFIREYRLRKAFRILATGDASIADVSASVGFNSTSYFTKCFTDYYGFSPGKTSGMIERKSVPPSKPVFRPGKGRFMTVAGITAVITLLILLVNNIILNNFSDSGAKRSIVITPLNMEEDNKDLIQLSKEVMEFVSADLENDFNILSRTKNDRSAIELARELNVTHVLEGNIIRSGKFVRIDIRLYDELKHKFIWSENFLLEIDDLPENGNSIGRRISTGISRSIYEHYNEEVYRSAPFTVNLTFFSSTRDRTQSSGALERFHIRD